MSIAISNRNTLRHVKRLLFFFKQKTAYEMRISDWSSDVCSSDLADTVLVVHPDGLSQIESGGREVKSGPSAIGEVKSIDLGDRVEIGRASCRERVCQYV